EVHDLAAALLDGPAEREPVRVVDLAGRARLTRLDHLVARRQEHDARPAMGRHLDLAERGDQPDFLRSEDGPALDDDGARVDVLAPDGVAVHRRVVGGGNVERRPHVLGDDATECLAQGDELGRGGTSDLGEDPILAILHRNHGDIIRGMAETRAAGFWLRALAAALDFAILALVQASYGALSHLVWST